MSAGGKLPGPHPLPLTRQWVKDDAKWVAEGCPLREEEEWRRAAGVYPGMPFEAWLGKDPAPDLQELVAHFGGYDKITPEAWAAYDRATAEWQQRRRKR